MNSFNARAASSSTRILTFSLQNGLGRAALTSSLTKNLIRSGLKFNHSLKELILDAIGGWCPLHLIVAQLLYSPALSGFAVSSDYTRLRFFFSLFFSRTLGSFSSHDRAPLGNNLFCIDIKPCYLIELPSLSLLKRHGWQHFLAWAEFKDFPTEFVLRSNLLLTGRIDAYTGKKDEFTSQIPRTWFKMGAFEYWHIVFHCHLTCSTSGSFWVFFCELKEKVLNIEVGFHKCHISAICTLYYFLFLY